MSLIKTSTTVTATIATPKTDTATRIIFQKTTQATIISPDCWGVLDNVKCKTIAPIYCFQEPDLQEKCPALCGNCPLLPPPESITTSTASIASVSTNPLPPSTRIL